MISDVDESNLDVRVSAEQVDRLLQVEPSEVTPAETLTFARNVFFPLCTACRYTCSYCTFFDPPGEASLMTPTEIRETARRGAEAGCTEALFTFGDDPDSRYDGMYPDLEALGHDSIQSYLREASQIALDAGLLPHANPGDQTHEQMAAVADVTASMGVMLETTADVEAHAGSRAKSPAQRLDTIRTAGELRIPFTTGILVGIGEGWRDRAESLLAIAALQEQFGHIQEVIVQPVSPNERWHNPPPSLETMRRVVAMARVALPETVAVQVPPNLAPVRELYDAGVDDLGGVSPVTDDYVNPSHEWPAVEELRGIADDLGVGLVERLPVYDRFLPKDGDANDWIPEPVGEVLHSESPAGELYRSDRGRDTDPE